VFSTVIYATRSRVRFGTTAQQRVLSDVMWSIPMIRTETGLPVAPSAECAKVDYWYILKLIPKVPAPSLCQSVSSKDIQRIAAPGPTE
jgi:hypothetical protein